MIIKYSKVYYDVFLKVMDGRYTAKDKRKFDKLVQWLIVESENSGWLKMESGNNE